MTMFADARTDDAYNEDFLNKMDKTYLAGFDYALECITCLFKGNVDVYENELSETKPENCEVEEGEIFATRPDLYDIVKENGDLLALVVSHWHESERDMLIASLIDNMDENEYQAIRNKVLKENAKKKEPKEYFDSRHFAFTGEKVFRKE